MAREFPNSPKSMPTISFLPLERSDFPVLQKWLAAPHVAVWWNESCDMSTVEAKYGPVIDGCLPMYVYLIAHKDAQIGWIQWYRWRDFPEHANRLGADESSAGIDLAIGEVEMTGRGLGGLVIREFAEKYIFLNTDISSIVADPAKMNFRSVSAFRKAGFDIVRTVRLADEASERQVVRLARG